MMNDTSVERGNAPTIAPSAGAPRHHGFRSILIALIFAAPMLVTTVGFGIAARADDFAPGNPFTKFADPTQSVLAIQTTFASEATLIRVVVYDSADSFLKTPVAKLHATLDDTGLALLPVTSLTGGQVTDGNFAFVVYLDENEDGRLTRNFLGKPVEPYIFTNGVRPKLSRPSFEETRVTLSPGKVIIVTLDE